MFFCPKAPLCKGGWQIADLRQFDWGIAVITIPPSKIKDFGHLPLHKGGSRCALQLPEEHNFPSLFMNSYLLLYPDKKTLFFTSKCAKI